MRRSRLLREACCPSIWAKLRQQQQSTISQCLDQCLCGQSALNAAAETFLWSSACIVTRSTDAEHRVLNIQSRFRCRYLALLSRAAL